MLPLALFTLCAVGSVMMLPWFVMLVIRGGVRVRHRCDRCGYDWSKSRIERCPECGAGYLAPGGVRPISRVARFACVLMALIFATIAASGVRYAMQATSIGQSISAVSGTISRARLIASMERHVKGFGTRDEIMSNVARSLEPLIDVKNWSVTAGPETIPPQPILPYPQGNYTELTAVASILESGAVSDGQFDAALDAIVKTYRERNVNARAEVDTVIGDLLAASRDDSISTVRPPVPISPTPRPLSANQRGKLVDLFSTFRRGRTVSGATNGAVAWKGQSRRASCRANRLCSTSRTR